MSDINSTEEHNNSANEFGEFDIAITGMSLRFPGARSPEQYWQNLHAGVSSIKRFTEQELADAGVSSGDIHDPRYVPVSGYLENAGDFDAELFKIPRSEARIIDPQHRLFLECAWDALEDAGYDPQALDGRNVGCYGGAGMAIYSGSRVRSYLSEYLEPTRLESLAPLQAFIATQNDHLCMRVSHRLGLRGPSISVQTACSTGLVAIHLAAQSLLVGETDMAIAGAAGIHFPVKRGYLYEEGGILSPDGVCRPFDARASGTVGGSGAAVVVLRRLEDAVADGDPIWAVIKGSAVNNDGASRAGYLAPSVEGQRDVITRAQRVAGVTPQDIGFVEAHGTATSLGDSIELTALTEVFSECEPRSTLLGAVKSSIGHLDTAAGMAGLIKAVLAVRHGEIPGTLNFEEPSRILSEQSSPFTVSSTSAAWPIDRKRRLAGVSSFGGGGTNAHLIVGEAPVIANRREPGPFALALSGRNAEGLKEQASAYANALRASDEGSIAAICQTATQGRPVFGHRAVVIGADRYQICERLDALASGKPAKNPALRGSVDRPTADHAVPVKPVFLFSGQGSTLSSATASLRDLPVFADALAECRDASPGATDWFEMLNQDSDRLKTEARLAQPALFAFQYALTRVWAAAGVTPAAVLGHSLGEYAAACSSGVMTVETAMALVTARGVLMDKYGRPTGMLAVMASPSEVTAVLRDHPIQAEVAVVNGDRAVVIGGSADALNEAKHALGADVMTVPLETTHGFHTSAVDPMMPAFSAQVGDASLRRPEIQFESTSDGNQIPVYEHGYWVDQVRKPVNFTDAFRRLAAKHELFLEIGPSSVLTNLGRRIGGDFRVIPSLHGTGSYLEQLYDAAGALHESGSSVEFAFLGGGSTNRARTRAPLSQRIREELWASPASSTPPPRDAGGVKKETARIPLVRELPATTSAPGSNDASCPGILFGQVGWADGGSYIARFDVEDIQHWLVVVSAGHPHRGPLLALLEKQNYSYSVAEADQLGALMREAGTHSESLGLLYLPDVDNRRPWHVVTEAAAVLLELVSRDDDRDGIDRIVVLRFRADADEGELSVSGEAVDALVRCVRLEHPQTEIMSEVVGSEDLNGALPQLLQSGYRDVRLRHGRPFTRQILESGVHQTARGTINADVTYVVSGGTGGIGRHVLRWLTERGARHIVVINRAVSTKAAAMLDQLRKAGADILMASADVADQEQMDELSAFIHSSMPPVRGVLHLAGVVEDATLMTMGASDIERVFRPKVLGAERLLAMTSSDDLDFFVAFSSIAAVFGSPGQSAYAAANASLDAMIERERDAGRRGFSTINWGPWSGDGMLDSVRNQFAQNSSVFEELDPHEALTLLDRVVSSAGQNFIAAGIRENESTELNCPLDVATISHAIWEKTTAHVNAIAVNQSDQEDLAGRLNAAPKWRQAPILMDYLCGVVSDLLELPDSDIDVQKPLKEIGIDSLYWVRLRNRLVADIGFGVSLTLIYSFPTIESMATHLLADESNPR